MHRKHYPRPFATSLAGYLMMLTVAMGAVRGFYSLNGYQYEKPLLETLPYVILYPIVAGICAPYIFRGAQWARALFWVLAGPIAVTGLVVQFDTLNFAYTFSYVACALLLASRNSHWYFTGRDYRRRPVAPPKEDAHSGHGASRRRHFEY